MINKYAILSLLAALLSASSCKQLKQTSAEEYFERCRTHPNVLRDIKKITEDVVDSLNEHKITYWLDSGTLIGAYRFGSHMPFDDDADLGILREDYEAHRTALFQSLERKGYKIVGKNEHPNSDTIPQIYFKDDPKRPHLDFFLFEPEGKDRYRLSSGIWHKRTSKGFSRDSIFHTNGSLGRGELLGRHYNIPAKLDDYFAVWYPETDILHNFYIHQGHGSDPYCDNNFAVVKDIKEEPRLLGQMLGHLEWVYGYDFSRAHSRLQVD